MKELRVFFELAFDGILHLLPQRLIPKHPYAYAFLVHPRDKRDIERKIAPLRGAPRWLIRSFERYFWPGTLAHITGLTSAKTGEAIHGYVISIPMTAETMLEDRPRAKKQIRKALRLAQKKGAQIAGLGALTASLTHGGNDLIDISGIAITTGHAYTGFNVTETAYAITHALHIPFEEITVAIVGAAGSIGSIAGEIFATNEHKPKKLFLIDIVRKKDRVEENVRAMRALNADIDITVSADLDSLKDAHVVITATSAPEALLYKKHLTPGTIIVDDAQPSDVADEVLRDDDTLVLSAGAVETPHIETHFPMGLHGKHTNYCCLAEVLALASEEESKHYVIQRATLDKVTEIAAAGRKLGFSVAPFQNAYGFVAQEKREHVGALLRERLRMSE